MSNTQVAKTILSQIKSLDSRAMWAWGAKDLIAMPDGLKFKTSGLCRWKGYVYVKYNQGTDLYDIQFFRLRKMEVKMDYETTDIFCDKLVDVIDSQVG